MYLVLMIWLHMYPHFWDNFKECKRNTYQTYDRWFEIGVNCTNRMRSHSNRWDTNNILMEMENSLKTCKQHMTDDNLDDTILQLQEFTNDLVNSANFANCLCGTGNLYDIKAWWSDALSLISCRT